MTTPLSRPAPPSIPSHAAFLLAQIRSSLAHLHTTSSLDDAVFHQVDSLLTRGTDGSQSVASQRGKESVEGEDKVGKNNEWLRKTMTETSLLPSIVELAMNIAVPSALLGDSQREAIVKLVEMSQEKIAKAVTDPENQKRTRSGAWSGAKGAHSGIIRGWNVAGQSMAELSRKREDARAKAEMKKTEKREEKMIKEELKREREEIARKRQMAIGAKDTLQSEARSGSEESPAVSQAEGETGASTSAASVLAPPPSAAIEMSDTDGEAMVSVNCSQMAPNSSVAATTTFSPWPGLLLTSTLVVNSDEGTAQLEGEKPASVEGTPAPDHLASLPPPPRRTAPASVARPNAVLNGSEGEGENSGREATYARVPMGGSSSQPLMQPRQSASSHSSSLPPPARTVPTPQPSSQAQGEVVDVTEEKQTGWAKRLGL